MVRSFSLLTVFLTSLFVVPYIRGEDFVQIVTTLLSDPDKEIRALGLEQVRSQAKGAEATRKFAALLPTLPPEVQAGLLGALADRGDSAARPAVLEILAKTSDDAVRVAAISAIGPLGESQDAARLAQSLAAKEKAEQSAARASLVRLSGDETPGAIVAEIARAAPAVQVALVEILATRRALSAVPKLLELAIGDEPSVRAAAMTALGQLATKEQLGGLVAGILKAAPGAERVAAERALALVVGRIENPAERAPALLAEIERRETDRLALLSALGRVGGPAALAAIERAIADKESHDAGIRALCNWPDASTAARLIEISQSDAHGDHQKLALAALIRVAPLPDGRDDAKRLDLVKQVMGLCKSEKDQLALLGRVKAIRSVDALRFVVPYMEKPAHAEAACEAVVELAHHRTLREQSKAEFHAALDRAMAVSKDPVVKDRAVRYKNNQTWTRPKPAE